MYNKAIKLKAIDIYKRNFGNISKVINDLGKDGTDIDRTTWYAWEKEDKKIKGKLTFKQLKEKADDEFLDTGDQLVKEIAIMGKDRGMLKFLMSRRHPDYKRNEININMTERENAEKERNEINELLKYAKRLPATDADSNGLINTGSTNEESVSEDISQTI